MSDQERVLDHIDEPGGQSPPIVAAQIEAAIARHPEVLQAVVVWDCTLGEGRLVAYVVAASSRIEQGGLRAHLGETLPPDMLPHHIVFLSGLPLTPEGELDRIALPAPHRTNAANFPLDLPPSEAQASRAHAWVSDAGRTAARQSLDNQERERKPIPARDGVTGSGDPGMEPVHRPIERRAECCPDAIAAVFEGESLDYGELNCRSNRLARHLRALGVGPDVCVGVLMERSLDLPVALLAVLKAGGAFVPLDPEYPRDRLAYMLTDSSARVVLTQSWLCERLPEGCPVQCVCMDSAWDSLGRQSGTNLDTQASPDHLAYVIYTSGSTGRPKGVELLHRGLSNHTAWLRNCLDIRPEDRILQCNSISFDGTLVEFFGPLQGGAALVIALPERNRDTQYLAALIAEQQVTLLNFVPSALRSLLAEPTMGPGHVRYVACGGEALTPDLVRRLREVVPGVRLGNFYGPTETTMNAMYFEVPQDADLDAVPIGKPIDNVWCEVLDDHRHPVAPGVVGELWIGGAGVARGYLNQPGLTAERFIVDPVRAGGRRYRTGDRVIQRPDGHLEFIGRNDAQVKLRGFRVELGEVEAALAAIYGVEACAAIVREDVAGVTRLVAYLSGECVDVARLRDAMRLRLPRHMLPSAYVKLPRLPTLPSGKIDRARLPAPSPEDFAHREFEAPRGNVERTIADIWQTLLGVGRVGRNDNFFELGGHSLLLVTMLQRLRENELTVDARMAFAHPTVAALAAAMAVAPPRAGTGVLAGGVPGGCTAIAPAMFPLLDISAQDLERISAGVPGGASNILDVYPLLPLQEGMVFHHRLQEQGDSYLSRWLLEFDSWQRLDRFLKALQQVIDRHDAFRTAIFWDGLARPVQVVLRKAQLPVQRIGGMDGGSGRERLLERTDPRRQRLPLGKAPLFSAFTTPDVEGDGWTLALLTHHIVCDQVSQDLLWGEIAAIVADDASGLPQPVPLRSLVGQVLATAPDAAHAYFKRELGEVTEPTVPFGLSDVRGDGNQVSNYRVALEPQVAARVRAAARVGGVSTAVLFHVAWAMVLARCCNSEDVVFGTVLSGRLAIDSEAGNRMGLCMNTLPLRVDLKGRTASETVRWVHARLAELVEHEHTSLVLAQACSAVPSSSPLFTSVLNYRHGTVGARDPATGATTLPGLDGVVLVADEERTNYPVVLTVDQYPDGYAMTTQCVAGADPVRLAAYVLTAVEALASALHAGGDAVVAELDILPPDEHARITLDYSAGARTREESAPILEQVAAQVERSPEASALRFDDSRLSYRELYARVNRAARVLRDRGVRRGARVGLCLARSQDMVVALLAILRAGGTYVPLDPEYPAKRLEFMACDADLELVVGGAGPLPMSFPSERILRVADLAPKADGWSGEPLAPDPERDARKEDAAYVIYTSGSTGTPKGVVVAHGAMENFLASMSLEPGLTCSDRLVAVTTLSFDIAVLELLLPLCVGAEVVLASRATAMDGRALRLLLESSEATAMQATPSTWRLLIEAGWRGTTDFKAMVGGEALTGALAAQLLERSGELWNMYGPTETTVWSSCWKVRSDRAISIGRPIANTCIHVLDKKMRPCPIGVPGEIHIGGCGLSLGYHNRADLTAQRFVVSPFDPAAGARLYRTGDRGRWCADGLLEHMGRLDCQIKLRGHRIEPGEIEAVLATHPQVLQAAVLGDDTLGDARLVAYVVPGPNQPEASELRAHLRRSLPEYMLPQHILFLSSLPLAPNGKLDRSALPAPYKECADNTSFKAPRGELEEAIADLWQELLGLERVGRYDNFFDLGGHSLLAMRLISRIESSTGCRVTLLQLASGSVCSIAQHIAASSKPKPDVWPRLRAWLGGLLRPEQKLPALDRGRR
jgi:amino acid adenylation domain-containing protein